MSEDSLRSNGAKNIWSGHEVYKHLTPDGVKKTIGPSLTLISSAVPAPTLQSICRAA